MRSDDEQVAKCGAYGAGILVVLGLAFLGLAVGIVAKWMLATDGDIRS